MAARFTLGARGTATTLVQMRPRPRSNWAVAAVVTTSSLADYAFARGEVILIPNFLTIRSLHLINTYAALILPFSAGAFCILLLRQPFMQIPRDLYDAAVLDGTGHLRFSAAAGRAGHGSPLCLHRQLERAPVAAHRHQQRKHEADCLRPHQSRGGCGAEYAVADGRGHLQHRADCASLLPNAKAVHRGDSGDGAEGVEQSRVEFEPDAHFSLWDLLRVQDEREAILARPVDLVEKASLRNPFRRRAILQDVEVVYAI